MSEGCCNSVQSNLNESHHIYFCILISINCLLIMVICDLLKVLRIKLMLALSHNINVMKLEVQMHFLMF
jgi:hypothetical protein